MTANNVYTVYCSRDFKSERYPWSVIGEYRSIKNAYAECAKWMKANGKDFIYWIEDDNGDVTL